MEWRDLLARVLSSSRARAVAACAMLAVVGLGAFGLVAWNSRGAASPAGAQRAGASNNREPPSDVEEPTATTRANVVVAVAGAVTRPGVVTLANGARVVDAIDAAGGARPDADANALNLAAKLSDGVRVYVPKVGEHVAAPAAGVGSGSGSSPDGSDPSAPLDLNTASQAQLEALPGIGPSLAQAIIAARTRLGGFHSVDDLRQVRGIGEHRFADLKSLVTV